VAAYIRSLLVYVCCTVQLRQSLLRWLILMNG